MSDTYHWPPIREEAIELFDGELPQGPTEAEIVDAFRHRPRSVINAIHQLAAQTETGTRPRSYWAVLRSRVQNANSTGANVHATDEGDRERAVTCAEAWIRNAGIHIGGPNWDGWREVEDELFGERGRLRSYDTPSLRTQMEEFWRQQRPRGQKAEADALKRAAKWKADRKRLAEQKAAAIAEADARQEAMRAERAELEATPA
jgi:hypothetical protein